MTLTDLLRQLNAQMEKSDILELGGEFQDYAPYSQQLYQKDLKEFNRIFKDLKKKRKRWKGFESPWDELGEVEIG